MIVLRDDSYSNYTDGSYSNYNDGDVTLLDPCPGCNDPDPTGEDGVAGEV